jgi:hypothetical protein
MRPTQRRSLQKQQVLAFHPFGRSCPIVGDRTGVVLAGKDEASGWPPPLGRRRPHVRCRALAGGRGQAAVGIEAVNLFLAGEFPNRVFVLGMEPAAVAADAARLL